MAKGKKQSTLGMKRRKTSIRKTARKPAKTARAKVLSSGELQAVKKKLSRKLKSKVSEFRKKLAAKTGVGAKASVAGAKKKVAKKSTAKKAPAKKTVKRGAKKSAAKKTVRKAKKPAAKKATAKKVAKKKVASKTKKPAAKKTVRKVAKKKAGKRGRPAKKSVA